MTQQAGEQDYVLGTTAAEIDRLELQHRVWRARAEDAWRRAGFTQGHHLVDIGCGPGHAAIDLAAVVGPRGKITALDRSDSYLDSLRQRCSALRLDRVQTVHVDLDADPLPDLEADGAWCRWVFSFLRNPRQLVGDLRRVLRPRGTLVLHEYFAYGTWRFSPPLPELDRFVETVMASWRAYGGDPDIALKLLPWLSDAGFSVREVRPIVDIISPKDNAWTWLAAFVDAGSRRLVQQEYLTGEAADTITSTFESASRDPNGRMVTPGVLEIIAVLE